MHHLFLVLGIKNLNLKLFKSTPTCVIMHFRSRHSQHLTSLLLKFFFSFQSWKKMYQSRKKDNVTNATKGKRQNNYCLYHARYGIVAFHLIRWLLVFDIVSVFELSLLKLLWTLVFWAYFIFICSRYLLILNKIRNIW